MRVIVRILHFSINALNIYCMFPYTQQPPLLANLKTSLLLFPNPKQRNISNPHIMRVLGVHLYRSTIPANLFLHRIYTFKSMEIQTIRTHNKFQLLLTWPYTKFPLTSHAATSSKVFIGNSSKSLVSRTQNRSQFPTTLYDRNFGLPVPTVPLHMPQNSPPQFQNKPSVGRFF
jgi:hypothetical protein